MRTSPIFCLAFAYLLCVVAFPSYTAFAATPEADRIAIEATVRADVERDLAMPYKPKEGLAGRTSIDGRGIADFDGDIVEFWLNLECTYCGIQEPLKAQRDNKNIRLIVRHMPTDKYSESLKKALSYEALKVFSSNAANLFWDKIIPKTSLAIPMPYDASLMLAFQEAAISPERFGEALTEHATDSINTDIRAGYGRIPSTPTYVLNGIRFPACNFTAEQLTEVLPLAKEARRGNADAKERIIEIIVQGRMGEIAL